MDNPVARVLQLTGTPYARFRAAYEFSKDGLTQALNGSYVTLPSRMVEALDQITDYAGLKLDAIVSMEYPGAENIEEAYIVWQDVQRKLSADKLPADPFRWTDTLSPAHFFMVDAAGSRDRFAKMFCLPRATLMRWERGLTKGMPVVVAEMLTGLSYGYKHALVEAQAAWVQEHS